MINNLKKENKNINFLNQFKKLNIKKGKNINFTNLYFNYRLISLEECFFEIKHLEFIRRFFSKIIRKKGQIKSKIFMNLPLTKKNTKSRMGKGKGKIFNHVFYLYPGKTVFEISLYSLNTLYEIKFLNLIKKINKKLNVTLKFYKIDNFFKQNILKKHFNYKLIK